MSARVVTPRGTIDVTMPLVGRGNLANVLAATAVALEFEVPPAIVAARASRLTAASHRGEVLRLRAGVTLVDDSYNANPTATLRALDVLVQTSAVRRVAILGEMLELGGRSTALHEDVGQAVAARRIDLLYTIGGAPAAAMADAAVRAGMGRTSVRHFDTSEEAAEDSAATIRSGDVVLVKGSRGVKTDRVVERLKAERG